MNIKEQVVALLKANEPKAYVYVAKDTKNLDVVRTYVMESVDFKDVRTKIVLVAPLGLGLIRGPVDGIFFDEDSTTREFVEKSIPELTADHFIKAVNPESQEILQ